MAELRDLPVPRELRPSPLPPRPAGDGGYAQTAVRGPFVVVLPDAEPRMGGRLQETRDQGQVYLTWWDGDRVHSLPDGEWELDPLGTPSLAWNGPEGVTMIRPLLPLDYADEEEWAALPVEVVAARLRQLLNTDAD